MSQPLRAPIATLALALVVACSSSTSPSAGNKDAGGVGQDLVTAAQDTAKAICDRTQACAPALIIGLYGDLASCVARGTATFAPTLGAKGSNVTAASMKACAQALASASCGDFLSNQLPAACTPPAGALADGAACAADAQCATSHCKVTAGKTCGTCGSRAAANAACVAASDCAVGLSCVSGVCKTLGTTATACSASAPCRGDSVCHGGSCSAPVASGTACAEGDGCDELHGVVCAVPSKQCVTVTYGGANAGCGVVPVGLELCSAGGFCKGFASPKYQGTCVAAAADDAACDVANGPYCNAGATCVDGKCTIPDPAKCQ